MWNNWVIDATLYNGNGLLCFVPIEHIESGNPTFVLGMNFLSDIEHFNLGKIRGIIHSDGQKAVDEFCKNHPEIIEKIKSQKA